MICLRACKNSRQEFRRQAVQLFRSTPGATFKGIAADLGFRGVRWRDDAGAAHGTGG